MEKFLRLLNPKSINYEADRIDGGTPSLTAHDVLLAMSYAKFTVIQSHLINLFISGQKSNDEIKASAKIIHRELVFKKQAELTEDHEISLFIALVELFNVSANYKPSERNRAVVGGVSRMRIQRHLNKPIDDFKKGLSVEIIIIDEKITYQLI